MYFLPSYINRQEFSSFSIHHQLCQINDPEQILMGQKLRNPRDTLNTHNFYLFMQQQSYLTFRISRLLRCKFGIGPVSHAVDGNSNGEWLHNSLDETTIQSMWNPNYDIQTSTVELTYSLNNPPILIYNDEEQPTLSDFWNKYDVDKNVILQESLDVFISFRGLFFLLLLLSPAIVLLRVCECIKVARFVGRS